MRNVSQTLPKNKWNADPDQLVVPLERLGLCAYDAEEWQAIALHGKTCFHQTTAPVRQEEV